jgi:hypothetical protein
MSPRFEGVLFPRDQRIVGVLICSIAFCLSFFLMGRQIWAANWWLIDDHEIFLFLGARDHLPLSELFSTLLAKTEIGSWQGRFRPSYYFLRVLETCLWGSDVQLWYLTRTLCFGVFIASLWWSFARFVGFWLGAAFLVPILAMSFWPDIWARLGPAEIYGVMATGLLISGTVGMLSFQNAWARNLSVIVVTLAAIILIGSKETLIPVAAAAPAMLIFAAATKRLPISLALAAVILISAFGLTVVAITFKIISGSGTDIYANKIDASQLINAALGSKKAIYLSAGYGIGAIGLFGILRVLTKNSISAWLRSTIVLVIVLAFLSAVLVSQYVAYRMPMPTDTRYDFPAMLFLPMAFVSLAWYVLDQLRDIFGTRLSNYFSLVMTVGLVGYYLPTIIGFASSPLPQAVNENIRRTNAFFSTVQALTAAAKQAPQEPVILEAFGSGAYEPTYSMQIYLRALGADNPISVRLIPDARSQGVLYDGLERTLRFLEDQGGGLFEPLSKSLEIANRGCISVGLDGPTSPGCGKGFEIKW